MNNTLQSTPVMHSFRALWQWLMVKPGQALPTPALQVVKKHHPAATATHTHQAVTACAQARQPADSAQQAAPSRPVRVLQVVDIGQSPAQSGRLRISGRMADVCAELDRLAAREALLH